MVTFKPRQFLLYSPVEDIDLARLMHNHSHLLLVSGQRHPESLGSRKRHRLLQFEGVPIYDIDEK